MRYGMLMAVASMVVTAACGVDSVEVPTGTGHATQETVSGVFTYTLSPTTFTLNQIGVRDTGPISIIDGSTWLSASVSLHCTGTTTILGTTWPSIVACAREYDPTSTNPHIAWCTPILGCSGDTSYNVPMSNFVADAHHALSIVVQSSAPASVSVNSAVLQLFAVGS